MNESSITFPKKAMKDLRNNKQQINDSVTISKEISEFNQETKILFIQLQQKQKKELSKFLSEFTKTHQQEYKQIENYFLIHDVLEREDILHCKTQLDHEFNRRKGEINKRHKMEQQTFLHDREEEKNQIIRNLQIDNSENIMMSIIRRKNGIQVSPQFRSIPQKSHPKTPKYKKSCITVRSIENPKKEQNYRIDGDEIKFDSDFSSLNDDFQDNQMVKGSTSFKTPSSQGFFLSNNKNTLLNESLQKGNFNSSKSPRAPISRNVRLNPLSSQKHLDNSSHNNFKPTYPNSYDPSIDDFKFEHKIKNHQFEIEKDNNTSKNKTIKNKSRFKNEKEKKIVLLCENIDNSQSNGNRDNEQLQESQEDILPYPENTSQSIQKERNEIKFVSSNENSTFNYHIKEDDISSQKKMSPNSDKKVNKKMNQEEDKNMLNEITNKPYNVELEKNEVEIEDESILLRDDCQKNYTNNHKNIKIQQSIDYHSVSSKDYGKKIDILLENTHSLLEELKRSIQ